MSRDVVRYSPSGIPLIDCVLLHRSEQREAGTIRQVELELPAIGVESVVQRLAACPLDSTLRLTGFLANRSRKSTRPVFHILAFDTIESEHRKD